MSKAMIKEAAKQDAITNLLNRIKPGDRIYTCCRHPNGNQHSVHIISTDHDGKPFIQDITHNVAVACGFRKARDGYAIQQGGSGYSKTFQIVYALGQTLWPNGTPEVHGTRNGEPDRAGGYALKQSSL